MFTRWSAAAAETLLVLASPRNHENRRQRNKVSEAEDAETDGAAAESLTHHYESPGLRLNQSKEISVEVCLTSVHCATLNFSWTQTRLSAKGRAPVCYSKPEFLKWPPCETSDCNEPSLRKAIVVAASLHLVLYPVCTFFVLYQCVLKQPTVSESSMDTALHLHPPTHTHTHYTLYTTPLNLLSRTIFCETLRPRSKTSDCLSQLTAGLYERVKVLPPCVPVRFLFTTREIFRK